MVEKKMQHLAARGESRRPPLWLRILLMVLLVIAASVAFYINNQKIIDSLEP